MRTRKRIHVGTSGWKYRHWDTTFYPKDLKKADQLSYYQEQFSTVELNNSFYREPDAQQFAQWKAAVGDGFLYAVKANRYFTHLKKLKVEEERILAFLEKAGHLEEKLGPILFQLPPHWQINTERLAGFLSLLPPTFLYTFEFRNTSWYHPEIYALLAQHNCAFCIYELANHLSPVQVTASFVYVRLHGPGNKYQGSYSDDTLATWASQCHDWQAEGKDVFIYFDNDEAGYAAFNALTLSKLIGA